MLYPKNQDKKLDEKLFENPTAEYRGAPFWAWNCELNQPLLDSEIDCMKQMGLGGFLMHPRVGLSTKYLGDAYMKLIRGCVEKARSNEMLAWLYDEDKWPSGFAGGYVTKDKSLRRRFLLFTPTPYAADSGDPNRKPIIHVERHEDGTLLAKYDVVLDKDGCLESYCLTDGKNPKGRVWYAYTECDFGSPWFNDEGYVDTLSKKAIDKFIEITHEAYKKSVGDEFGKMVPAIFTDEPQFMAKHTLGFADALEDVVLPYTMDLPQSFEAQYGQSLLEKLPELFWELGGGRISTIRYQYHDHIAERFAQAFADNVGGWCGKNGLALTGHMMNEPTLYSQTISLGDTMRSYRGFQLPGIDMLCDLREFTTAKQAQSAVHQYGREGMLSELYGVTNWDFDFRAHKLSGDWQAALGVSIRAHHLYWVAMGGEAKRDYPASIGHQSPWYKEYSYIEDHFARINTVMTRGKPAVKVAVIHPVESYWLHWGPKQQTAGIRDELEKRFSEITEWLLFGLNDYDFICESLLPSQYGGSEDGFKVGCMQYDTVIVPSCETIRSTTLAALKDFRAHGGKVVFAGEAPKYVDAVVCDDAAKFAAECTHVAWSREQILDSIEPLRQLDIRKSDGSRADNLFARISDDGDARHIFICHVNHPRNRDLPVGESYKIILNGRYNVKEFDTLTGEIKPLFATVSGDKTVIDWNCYAYSSLLLELSKECGESCEKPQQTELKYVGELDSKVAITLEEPNVLLLDMADYRLDGGEWRGIEEILRLDNIIRDEVGYPLRRAAWTQPWVSGITHDTEHVLQLKYRVNSNITVKNAKLALESLEYTTIFVNGKQVSSVSDGKYVDDSIDTVSIPQLSVGDNEILLEIRYGKQVNVEAVYLLGDFGVKVAGRSAVITEPVRELCFGDATVQGLPFYGGNIVYHCSVNGDGSEKLLEADSFRGSLLLASTDGKRSGVIAIAPYRVSLGKLSNGSHSLDITAYGNRVNTFGCLHNADERITWFGPNCWRTTGAEWSYEYRLKQTGILITPRIFTK